MSDWQPWEQKYLDIAQTHSTLQTLPTFHSDSILILERESISKPSEGIQCWTR